MVPDWNPANGQGGQEAELGLLQRATGATHRDRALKAKEASQLLD
jgi:hypothetical protein